MQCQGAGRLGALRRAEGTGSQWCTDKRGRENMKCDVCQWTRCKVGHLQSWQRCGTTGMCAPCWWEANLVQLLQRQGNAHAMFPMGIYSGETHARAHQGAHRPPQPQVGAAQGPRCCSQTTLTAMTCTCAHYTQSQGQIPHTQAQSTCEIPFLPSSRINKTQLLL